MLLMKLTSSTFSLHMIYHLSRRRGYVSRKGRDAEIKETKIISRIVGGIFCCELVSNLKLFVLCQREQGAGGPTGRPSDSTSLCRLSS